MTPRATTALADEALDDLFHGCAFAAFVEQAIAQGSWPEAGATRRAAYAHYETALASRDESRDSQTN